VTPFWCSWFPLSLDALFIYLFYFIIYLQFLIARVTFSIK